MSGYRVSKDGEVLDNPGHSVRDFYVERTPVYAPGFGPDEPLSEKAGELGSNVSMARQEFADECDINVLMSKYDKVGMWPLPLSGAEPMYLDVSNVPDLLGASRVIADAQAAFMSLPASVRREFDNDAIRFVEFAQDPANLEKMREWKLAPPAPVEAPRGAVAPAPGVNAPVAPAPVGAAPTAS